ncbi:hypothetical protein HHI36_021263 [Cryptolaemus montrouzieri]|uniref:DNA-binding protein Ets97D n=1 Tax=Cryptolaemus montrouzieri TaxID=559131 RepID=A0ABD2MW85_9CUCU
MYRSEISNANPCILNGIEVPMDKHKPGVKAQTFLVTEDEHGQKIYTSESNPSKSFTIDNKGNMIEYIPKILEEDDSDSLNEDSSEMDVSQLEDTSQLGMINSLEGDFEDNLMHELDSGLMKMVTDPASHYLMQHMTIQEPLSKLKTLLEERLGIEMKNYKFFLQGVQELEGHRNLVDQCVQGEGLVQINVQIQTALKRINILDVLKPAEDYMQDDDSSLKESEEDDLPKRKNVVQWQVDLNFKKEQERLKIPSDPMEWDVTHVRHWLQWAVRHFHLPNIKLSDWSMNGEGLHQITLKEFQRIVPSDPDDVFWTHLELLRKMKVVAIMKDDLEVGPRKRKPKLMEQSMISRGKLKTYSPTSHKYFESNCIIKAGYNGQIQLWQFLLELLTSSDYKNIIHWLGQEGEFKLTNPESVAKLWGERKNKPRMNYEKLSRALRYYYDGDMISKVHGKRFVYKFVCDLKQLLGYSAVELSNLVNFGNPTRVVSFENLHILKKN